MHGQQPMITEPAAAAPENEWSVDGCSVLYIYIPLSLIRIAGGIGIGMPIVEV